MLLSQKQLQSNWVITITFITNEKIIYFESQFFTFKWIFKWTKSNAFDTYLLVFRKTINHLNSTKYYVNCTETNVVFVLQFTNGFHMLGVNFTNMFTHSFFARKCFAQIFMCLQLRLVILCQREIVAKAALQVLVKFTHAWKVLGSSRDHFSIFTRG